MPWVSHSIAPKLNFCFCKLKNFISVYLSGLSQILDPSVQLSLYSSRICSTKDYNPPRVFCVFLIEKKYQVTLMRLIWATSGVVFRYLQAQPGFFLQMKPPYLTQYKGKDCWFHKLDLLFLTWQVFLLIKEAAEH